jgi:hypothetical protein
MKHIDNMLKEETIMETADNVKTLGKFRMSDNGQWEPVHYAGYTLITPTFENDFENTGSYKKLVDIKDVLSKCLDLSKIVSAPANALHMTVARLISAEVFENSIMNLRELDFLHAFTQLFPKISISKPLLFEISGLSILPQDIITAMVSPVKKDDFKCLQGFRDYIYFDKALIELGVQRKRGFNGHITLFYIEQELSSKERQILANAIIDINRSFFPNPMSFNITRAEVRKFDNFLSFYREDNWPVYKFY